MKACLNSTSIDELSHLYGEHQLWLYTWLCKKLGNQYDAADIVQETFIRLLQKDNTYNYSQPRALLTTIAKNISHNLWRKSQIRQTYYDILASEDMAYSPSPEEELIAVQTLCELDDIFRRLTSRERKVFMLYQIEGLTYTEIMEQVGISLITVKRDMKKVMICCLMTMQLD